jgi:hypothetical protein
MTTKGTAFVKGGCGCLAAFLIVGVLMVVSGGSISIDAGGACLLFVIGGIIGLVGLWIYNKGVRDVGSSKRRPRKETPDFSNWNGESADDHGGESTDDHGGESDDWGN